jgi:hypothetical protein
MSDEASEAAHAVSPRLPEATKAAPGHGSSSNKELRALWRRRDAAEEKLRQRVEAAKNQAERQGQP